jgi:hypothetical protein
MMRCPLCSGLMDESRTRTIAIVFDENEAAPPAMSDLAPDVVKMVCEDCGHSEELELENDE